MRMTQTSVPPDSENSHRTLRCNLDEPAGPGPFSYAWGEDSGIAGWAFLDPAEPTSLFEVARMREPADWRGHGARCSEIPRPDVVAHFGVDGLEMSGFASTLRIDHRFSGEQKVRLLLHENSQTHHVSDLFSFSVAPSAYEASARRALAARFLRGAGLEIGALQRRFEAPDRCSVTYVDRMALVADLLTHYPELDGHPLQPPDLIDDGETLAKIESSTQDFVIANQFLEHCENPIQTRLRFMRVLKDDGILYMAVPDKRFTFDFDRPVTPSPSWSTPSATAVAATVKACTSNGRRTWPRRHRRRRPLLPKSCWAEQYSIHFNVWALPELLEFVARCKAKFGLPFGLEWLVCSENEVILILRKLAG